MPFETYDQVRGYAAPIRNVTQDRSMPPEFAIPDAGLVREDPSLTSEQISVLAAWAKEKAPAGDPRDLAIDPKTATDAPKPDLYVRMPQPVNVPTDGELDDIYEIVPTHLKKSRWVQMATFSSLLPTNLRQAVIFVRPPDSHWLRHFPVGKPFTAAAIANREVPCSPGGDILVVYTSAASPAEWPASMAKFLPAGADLIFRLRYIANGHAGADQGGVGLVFSKTAPAQRVLTLRFSYPHFVIPPGASDYRVDARATVASDVLLLGFFPDTHLRGKQFEYDLVHPAIPSSHTTADSLETLLRVSHDPRWQTSYRLVTPLLLKAGTLLQAAALYDNSPENPNNPDSNASVRCGDQARDETFGGFFDVAVPADGGRQNYLTGDESPH